MNLIKKFFNKQPKINMEKESDRLETFKNNWNFNSVSPNILAALGFYYKGPGDLVECHFCRKSICFWEISDNVAWEHYKFSENCIFLKNHRETTNKPININIVDILISPPLSFNYYVNSEGQDVCGIYRNNSEIPPGHRRQAKEDYILPIPPPLPQKRKINYCKICFDNKINCVYIPCGHLATCDKCAVKTENCPICRQLYWIINPIYHS